MLCLFNGNGPAQVSICNPTLHIVSQVPYTYIPLTNSAKVHENILFDRERTQDTEKIHKLAKSQRFPVCGRAGVRTQVQLPCLISFLPLHHRGFRPQLPPKKASGEFGQQGQERKNSQTVCTALRRQGALLLNI